MSFIHTMEELQNSFSIGGNVEIKESILQTSLKLFNDLGSDQVSLFQIAEACGLEIDELHTYFKNKKSIIRGLFYKIELFSVSQLWQIAPANREVRFADFMHFYFGSFAKYRFFFREFAVLLKNDPILANDWRHGFERMMGVMMEGLNGWIKQGLVKPFPTPKDAEMFLELVWVVAANTPTHVRARLGVTGSENAKEVNRYIAKFLYPYHTEKGQRVLDLYGG